MLSTRYHFLLELDREFVTSWLDENKVAWRWEYVDGEAYINTRDFNPDRVNLTIENNIITKISMG